MSNHNNRTCCVRVTPAYEYMKDPFVYFKNNQISLSIKPVRTYHSNVSHNKTGSKNNHIQLSAIFFPASMPNRCKSLPVQLLSVASLFLCFQPLSCLYLSNNHSTKPSMWRCLCFCILLISSQIKGAGKH